MALPKRAGGSTRRTSIALTQMAPIMATPMTSVVPDGVMAVRCRYRSPVSVRCADKATGAVVIRWITESELNNAGFNILRSESKYSDFKVVNVKGIIPGHGPRRLKSTSMSGRTHLQNPTSSITTRSKTSLLMEIAQPCAQPISEAMSMQLVNLRHAGAS